MTRRGSTALFVAVACAACAAGGGPRVAQRTFERSELGDIALKRLGVVVVAAGPPRVADTTFAVRGFAPPELGDALLVGTEDPETRDALIGALEQTLGGKGFELELHSSVHGLPSVPTTTTATVAPPPRGGRHLTEGQPLSELLSGSDVDAVLVVRVVPVDEFHLDFGTGTRVERTALGRERIKDFRPVRHDGRLIVGQAFLFDRRTGLRLWTRQTPDYPELGRLTPKHPFLAYGYVHRDQQTPLPRTAELAARATAAFVGAVLADFPAPQAGVAGAREALEAIDIELEQTVQRFRDQTHVGLEISGSWGMEPAQLEVSLFDAELAPLDTGAVIPGGVPRVSPQLTVLTRSNLMWSIAVPITIAPSGFERVVHIDAPEGETVDRTSVLRIEQVIGFGAELQLGTSLRLTQTTLLIPRGGIFGEVWSIDASPSVVLQNSTRVRLGVLGGADLMMLSDPDGWFFGRLGIGGRLGADIEGAFIYGFQLSLGVGVLL